MIRIEDLFENDRWELDEKDWKLVTGLEFNGWKD